MIAAFLDFPLLAQVAIVVSSLVLLAITGLLVWACWWPLDPDYQCECCCDADLPPELKEIGHE